jgi:signal transduction histidine kinase
MRQRAAAIGGDFSLSSAPGRGTSLQVVLRPQ